LDADTGQIAAATLTRKERDDGAEVGPLLDQVTGPVASFTADGAYDQESVSAVVAEESIQNHGGGGDHAAAAVAL